MSSILVRFFWDCGRQGDVEGLFITTREELAKAFNKDVYFGEILGKHSEVYGTLLEKEFEILSEDQDFISKLEDLLGSDISGYNPLNYELTGGDEEE